MAITRIVKLTFKPEHISDFETFYATIRDKVAAQPGCNGVTFLKEQENTGVFFTYSKWNSVNDLNNYRNTPVFGQIWPTIKVWFSAKAEAWTLDVE
jgi:quinol monooxygenase YgiN